MMTATYVMTNPHLLGLTAKEAVHKVGMEILRDTVRDCPVDLGTLAQSYTFDYTDTMGGKAEGRVGTNVEYAPWVEFGHGEIVPKRAKVLRWEKNGQVFFAHRVGPYPPRPHLGSAFHKAQVKYA